MRFVLVVAVMSSGCAGSWGKINRHVGEAALATSTLALVCDGMQTMRMAGESWTDPADGRGHYEANPIMGEHPSVPMVGAYFVGAIAINALAWVVTPERYRAPLPVAVTAVQAWQVADNTGHRAGICGF